MPLTFSEEKLATLSQSEKWLRLGHYEKGWWGYHSPFKGTFFLSARGHKDPFTELRATLEAFVNPTEEQFRTLKMHPQCYYRARFRFLNHELQFPKELIQRCEEREAWIQKLNAKGVSVIFASADMNNAPSTFGHTFLKLINPELRGQKESLNYGINYAADGNPGEALFYALKGLFGFYSGTFTMLPYHQKIREYTNMEGRDIWEYRLNLNESQVEELVEHLLEIEGGRAPYFFLSDNCSYQIVKALEVVEPRLQVSEKMPDFVIPLDTIKHIARTPGFTEDPYFQKSLKSDYLESLNLLNRAQRESLNQTLATYTLSDEKLSKEQKARVLETAMKFLAIRSYSNPNDFEDAKYRLSVLRAKLGMINTEVSATIPPRPEKSHDSSAIYAGFGESKSGGHFQSLKFRPAFHDLEQNSEGMLPFSHIEVLSVEARHFQLKDRVTLARLKVVELLNSSPLTKLDRHLSWRARASIEDQWSPDLLGGIGISQEILKNTHFIQLINARYSGSFLGAGPNFLLATRPSRWLGVSADAAYYFAHDDRRIWDFRIKTDFRLNRNWDLQFEHRNEFGYQAQILYNFLF
ncbi:MAG: DUF4105 domain-containing protein [Bdellovibrionales bacterium]